MTRSNSSVQTKKKVGVKGATATLQSERVWWRISKQNWITQLLKIIVVEWSFSDLRPVVKPTDAVLLSINQRKQSRKI